MPGWFTGTPPLEATPGTFRLKVVEANGLATLKIKFTGAREQCDRYYDEIERMVLMEKQSYQESMEQLTDELHYLRWFHKNVDFGPAHETVIEILQEQYEEEEAGRRVPEAWREEG